MSSLFGHSIGVMIVVIMLTFIGIWVWAWLPGHRETFERLSQIPMEDPLETADDCGLEETGGHGDRAVRAKHINHRTEYDNKGN